VSTNETGVRAAACSDGARRSCDIAPVSEGCPDPEARTNPQVSKSTLFVATNHRQGGGSSSPVPTMSGQAFQVPPSWLVFAFLPSVARPAAGV
jgi:hypothetical protein